MPPDPDATLGLPPAAAQPPQAADRRFGDYEIQGEIARGGMGIVYKARQLALDRTVAIKMILAGRLAGDSEIRRFQVEARAAANLQHPHIVAIHEVGEHGGQHFFSMDFVEGLSLAELIRDRPLSAEQAARYVRTIAAAIHYAHEQGTLHRDLKPSNVLIDRNDQPRVTDFGLAKRISGDRDASSADAERALSDLTATGQVLGTPGYMPPEQADPRRGPLSRASDVYSLGAILYELLAGRPPFRAETPLDTLMQVLYDDPVAPRLLNPKLGRDLETIVLKCLAKEPSRRYATAQSLADDLGAFLDGRPIAARRPGPIERGLHWFRRQRSSVALATAVAAATIAVVVAGTLGSVAYRQWRLGHVGLNTEAVALVADLTDESGRPAGRVPVPTEDAVPLATGSYDLRVSGRRALSETYGLFVPRGETRAFDLSLTDRELFRPLDVPHTFEILELDGRGEIILPTEFGVTRINGQTRETVWESRLEPSSSPDANGFRWNWHDDSSYSPMPFDRSPQLCAVAPDLNGDGTGDLVWAARHQAALIALSGLDGRELWRRVARRFPVPEWNEPLETSTVLGPPLTALVDDDETADFIVAMASVKADPADPSKIVAERWIEAISGKSGEILWTRPLPAEWFATNTTVEPIREFRWYYGAPSGSSSSSSGFSFGGSSLSSYRRGTRRYTSYADWIAAPMRPILATVGDREILAIATGPAIAAFDRRTGEQVGAPIQLGHSSGLPARFADVNGDGSLDAIVGRPIPGPNQFASGELDLEAMSLDDGRRLWQRRIAAEWGSGIDWYDPLAEWPLVEDLDGDGLAEVVVPHGGAESFPLPPAGIAVLAGDNGSIQWHTRLRSIDAQVNRFLVGDDIDGDRRRDLFVASLAAEYDPDHRPRTALFVDALSGADGRTLWTWQQPLAVESLDAYRVGPLAWWHMGADGLRQLVVPYAPKGRTSHRAAYVLAQSDGRLTHVGPDLDVSRVCDLDGDRHLDLVAFRPKERESRGGGGELLAFRGSAPEYWRRLGSNWRPAADFDGDGVTDAFGPYGHNQRLLAISGETGRPLWEAETSHGDYWIIGDARSTAFRRNRELATTPVPDDADLDRDDVADLLMLLPIERIQFSERPLLVAISGRDGQTLWESSIVPAHCADNPLVARRDLDRDGRPEVLLATASNWNSDSGERDDPLLGFQMTLWALSGETGAPRWHIALSDVGNLWGTIGVNSVAYAGFIKPWAQEPFDTVPRLNPGYGDLDRDGIDDLVLPTFGPKLACDLLAVSGADGRALWRRPLESRENAFYQLTNPVEPAVGDLDGDDKLEVVAIDYRPKDPAAGPDAPSKILQAKAFDGATGEPKWIWEMEVDAGAGRIGTNREEVLNRPRPLLVRLGGDERPKLGVCLWVWPADGSNMVHDFGSSHSQAGSTAPGQVIVLDDAGRELARFEVTLGDDRYSADKPFRVWNRDLDGDGDDELLFVRNRVLSAVEIAGQRTLFEVPLPSGFGDVVGAASADGELTVVAGDTIVGLTASGERLWHSRADGLPLPTALAWFLQDDMRHLTTGTQAPPLLLAVDPDRGPPRFLYALGDDAVVCRAATGLSTRERPATPSTIALPVPSGRDPRMARLLPWAWTDGEFWTPIAPFAVAFVFLTPFVVLGRRIARRPRWGLLAFLAAPLVVGVLLIVAQQVLSRATATTPDWYQIVAISLVGLPAMCYVWILMAAIGARNLRRVAFLIGAYVIVAAAMGVAAFAMDWSTRQPGEWYILDGWHDGLLPPLVVAGLLVIGVYALRAAWRTVRRRLSRRIPSHSPLAPAP